MAETNAFAKVVGQTVAHKTTTPIGPAITLPPDQKLGTITELGIFYWRHKGNEI